MKIFNLILVALGAALLGILSPFTLPIAVVPLTLQTLAVGLLAFLYQPRETFLSILLYCLLGFIGLPVFQGGTSGIIELFSPRGGYLLAFLFLGTCLSWLLIKIDYHALSAVFVSLVAYLLILVLGSIWIKYFLQISWFAAFSTGMLPFILAETVKSLLASGIGLALRRSLNLINPYFK